MKIVEIRVDVTINKGDYNSEKVGLTAQVDEGEEIIPLRKHLVSLCKGEIQVVEEQLSFESIIPKIVEEEVKEEAAPKKKVSKKAARPKAVGYDRTLEIHKKLFATTLEELFPKWNTSTDLKAKAKAASMFLEKEEFLSIEGDVLESFKEKLKKAMV